MPTDYRVGEKKVVLIRRHPTGLRTPQGGGGPTQTTGQLWPRGKGAPRG